MSGASEEAAAAGQADIFKTLGAYDELVPQELRDLISIQTKRELTEEEQLRLRELAEQANSPKAAPKRRVQLAPELLAKGTARLRFLCKLIRRDRRPWCPLNGILALVPWSSTESDESAKEAAAVLQKDLAAARAAFQQRCPTIALVCDLETARGFSEFRRGFPTEVLKQRLGQRLPLVPELPPAEVPELLAKGTRWLGQAILPAWILKFVKLDPGLATGGDGKTSTSASVAHNRNLYFLLHDVYMHGPRLSRVLTRGMEIAGDGGDALDAIPLFGGCYLAGTGKAAAEQAFVPGVFQRLTDGQSAVSWTNQALAEDQRYRMWTLYGYVATAVAALGLAGALVWWWKK